MSQGRVGLWLTRLSFVINLVKMTQKHLYIIPGFGDSGNEQPYLELSKVVELAGFLPIIKLIDWKRPFSEQIFAVDENDIIFGFSLGAILGWLVAQQHPCRHLILASMTLHKSFSDPEDKKALIELLGPEFIEDIIENLKPTHQAGAQTVLYGEHERESGDIIVPDAEHELTDSYINEISKLLEQLKKEGV